LWERERETAAPSGFTVIAGLDPAIHEAHPEFKRKIFAAVIHHGCAGQARA
jgi:hypothetical protein